MGDVEEAVDNRRRVVEVDRPADDLLGELIERDDAGRSWRAPSAGRSCAGRPSGAGVRLRRRLVTRRIVIASLMPSPSVARPRTDRRAPRCRVDVDTDGTIAPAPRGTSVPRRGRDVDLERAVAADRDSSANCDTMKSIGRSSRYCSQERRRLAGRRAASHGAPSDVPMVLSCRFASSATFTTSRTAMQPLPARHELRIDQARRDRSRPGNSAR